MEYLKYFENKTSAEGYKTESCFVGYLNEENLVLYSEGGEVIKDGEMVEDDIFIPEEYVDLGLSVMWASCNLGASSPEKIGNLFEWRGSSRGDVDYELSLDEDPVYQEASSDLKKFTPKTPTVNQIKELLNCNKVEEVLNGVPGTRFTGDNGNSIFIPENDYWTPITSNESTWITTQATSWSPSKGIQDNSILKTVKLPFRGICSSMPKGGAILLEYGKTIELAANDTNRLFCFPRTWEATKFVASTNFILNMYASPSAEFSIESTDGVTRRTYTYDMEDGHRVLYMSNVEMEKVTTLSTDDYIYVRFASNAPTTITPEQWDASDCASESILIRPNDSFTVLARSSETIFRMRYDDWVGYDITIQWSTKVPMPVYIGDTCSFPLSSTNSHVLQYAYIRPGGTYSISKDAIASWASRVNADGYLYVHFNPTAQGTVTFVTDNPAFV